MSNCKSCSGETELELHDHSHKDHDHSHDDHDHSINKWVLSFSLVFFFLGLMLQYIIKADWFLSYDWVRLIWFAIAYIPVALPVWKEALELIKKRDFFNEFSLMGIATLGAFLIQEYPEGVAVMLFYTIGEMFQDSAVDKAKGNIKALLDVRPKSATVFRNNEFIEVHPEEVKIGETIQVKVGESVPLDGILHTDKGSFNTSALTGESKPSSYTKGEKVLAGMINLEQVIAIETTNIFSDSSISKILQMVQDASSRKAKTELFIRKFAKIYTPIVFFLAVALVIVPALFVADYEFKDWLYRGLIFLVVSCPCALVISVPLGYFGGIGAASRNGILFKGSNFLELMGQVNVVVMDKTGTLTQGVFKVQQIETVGLEQNEFINIVSAIETQSTHPIAKAITEQFESKLRASNVTEIAGKGLKGNVNNKEVLVGNGKLLSHFKIDYPSSIDEIIESIVIVAVDGKYVGYITVADELKDDAKKAITDLNKLGIHHTVMLSGDKDSITQKVANEIGVSEAYGGLLPEGKVEHLNQFQNEKENMIAFVGDGINDAPVLALSDVGIAMGGLGSDAAIETADVIIQTDQPSKIATAIKIGRETRRIVIQNITLALVVKIIVLILGAGGVSNMWEAVFADVGVALLAIINAVRIQRMNFKI